MSFVVEIPSVFTKPTQIPVRLGNTILTGNETIQGSLSVNGSLTLNNGNQGDSTNVVNYDSLDISNNLNVGGITTLNEVDASSITTTNLVVGTTNIITELGTKQDVLTAGNNISIVDNVITSTGGSTIDSTTDLTSNSLTTTDLVVNESLNIDNVITYEKYKQFDTLVLRRVGSNSFFNINEIQVWVNDTNIMYQNASSLNGYFALWENNSVELEAGENQGVDKVYNNIILTSTESFGPSGTDSIIIKNIPSTFIKDIQAIVLYYRTNANTGRILNLQFELYNSVNDPNLTQILAQTPTIVSVEDSYRYDFPSFDTYTLGTTGGGSTSQITSGGLIEDGIINTFDAEVNIAGNLNVNGGVDIDTGEYFDTLVVRRLSLATDTINLNELQVWVNGSNILVENSATLTSYFADWSVDKDEDLGEFESNIASKIYNNEIESNIGAHSSGANILIIKNIPSTDIKTIQALVLYNRTNNTANQERAIGLAIELYNEANDPDLIRVLANTNEISVSAPVYRFDFPSITTYSAFVTGNSITNIIREEDATTETANYELTTFEVKGNASITGDLTTTNDLTVGGLLTKSNTIRFKAYTTQRPGGEGWFVVNSGNNLPYNETQYDIGGGYDKVNYHYVVPVAGTYFFGGSWFKDNDTTYIVDYEKNGVTVRRNEFTIASGGAFTIVPTFLIEDCVVGDIIRLRVKSNSVRVGYTESAAPNGWTHFEGYRLG